MTEILNDEPVIHDVYLAKKKLYLAIVAMRKLAHTIPTKNPVYLMMHQRRIADLERIWGELGELGCCNSEYMRTGATKD